MPDVISHFTIYRDPRYYAAFPAVEILANGEIAVLFRRGRDQRWLIRALGMKEAAHDQIDHIDARSELVLMRLSTDFNQIGELTILPPLGEAASQDANLLACTDDSILVTSFSWYPLSSNTAAFLRANGSPIYNSQDGGSSFLFWGGYSRLGSATGETWKQENFLPPVPGAPDIIQGVLPHRGGAIRGRAVKTTNGTILTASYAPKSGGRRGSHLFASSNGNNWRYVNQIATDESKSCCLVEPALQISTNGRLFAFHRTVGSNDQLVTAFSDDNGNSWSSWKRQPIIGHPYDPLRLKDGRFLLTYGYRHGPYGVQAHLYDPKSEEPGEGINFTVFNNSAGPDTGYPWAIERPDGTVFVVAYATDPQGVRIITGTLLNI